MDVVAVTAAAAAVAAMGLLSVWLFRRMRREDRLEAAALRRRSLEDFQAAGYSPDQVLYCGSASRQIQLLADSRSGILRIDILWNDGGSRRDIQFQDLLGCQLLENGAVAEQVGRTSGGRPRRDGSRDSRVESLGLVLYLSDALEPVVGIDLLLSPADRADQLLRQARAFAADALSLARRILEDPSGQGSGSR